MVFPGWLADSSEEAQFLRLVLDHVSDCLVAVDTTGTIVLINEPYCRLLAGQPDDFLGRHITDVVGPQTKLHFVAQGVGTHVGYPLDVRGHKLVTKQVPVHRDGRIVGAVGLALFSDFDALKKTYSRISKAELAMPRRPSSWQSKFKIEHILGTGARMDAYREELKVAAQYDLPLLISGETGAGKELAAQVVHSLSERSEGPFVWINCASIPSELIEAELFGYESGAFTGASNRGKAGKFEIASGGTLFLDEIGDMPFSLQGSLLRVLQSNEIVRVGGTNPIGVDLRLICATHRRLAEFVYSGKFREDLYHRLNVLPVNVPSLRDRADITFLIDELLSRAAVRLGKPTPKLSPQDRQRLSEHTWPGNVRELENALMRFVVSGKVVLMDTTPARSQPLREDATLFKEQLRLHKEEEVRAALERAHGNKSRAAELLGISRAHLYRLLQSYT